MKTGIVILNYNDYETTKEMLENIKNYKVLDYIVVVDNFSKDNSYEKLLKYENKKIKVIKTDKNRGYAYGNNYGVKYLIDNYKIDNIIISNPDIIVKEEAIEKLVKDLKENKNISLIAPVVHQNGEISRGWKLPRFIDEVLSNMNYIHRFARKKLFYNEDHYKEEFSKVDVVSGCFFMIRKDVFEEINFFDEGTFLYYEENIIGHKLKDINKESYVDNTVSIIHNESVLVNKSISSINKYKILKTSQKYYEKNYNHINIFKMFILRFVYYISLIVSYLIYFITKPFKK